MADLKIKLRGGIFGRRETQINWISKMNPSLNKVQAGNLFDYLSKIGAFRVVRKTKGGENLYSIPRIPVAEVRTITFDFIGTSEAPATAGHDIYWLSQPREYITLHPRTYETTSRNPNLTIEIGASRSTKGNEDVLIEARGSMVLDRGGKEIVGKNQTEIQTKLFDFIGKNDLSKTKKISSNIIDEIEKAGRRLIPTDKLPEDFTGSMEFKDPGTKETRRKYSLK